MLRHAPSERFGITGEPRLDDDVVFQMGAMITAAVPQPLVFTASTTAKHPPADYVEYDIPVFSDRLVGALRNAGVDNLQLFPARLHNPQTGEQWQGYQAVNILGLVSCLAIAESKAKPDLPPLYAFDLSDLVIQEARTGGALLFRLAESPSVVLLERRVGDALLDSRPEFRGIELRDVESV